MPVLTTTRLESTKTRCDAAAGAQIAFLQPELGMTDSLSGAGTYANGCRSGLSEIRGRRRFPGRPQARQQLLLSLVCCNKSLSGSLSLAVVGPPSLFLPLLSHWQARGLSQGHSKFNFKPELHRDRDTRAVVHTLA